MNKLFLYFICLVSALGGLLFGYDWVVIGGAKPFYEVYFGIASSPSMQGLAMSIALAGCLVGATTCGALADRLGRKPLLLASAALFLGSAWATVRCMVSARFSWRAPSGVWPSAWRRASRPCTSPRWLRLSNEAASWPSTSSPSCWASWPRR